MPHLVAFNRPWSVGSDDSSIVAACFLAVRVAWLCVFSAIVGMVDVTGNFLVNADNGQYVCRQVGLLQAYISVEIVLVLFTIFILIAIMVMSFRGSMMETNKRRRIVPMWVANVVLMALDLIWSILGAAWTFGYGMRPDCGDREPHQQLISLLIAAVVGQWIMHLFLISTLYCIYSRVGDTYGVEKENAPAQRISRRLSMYRRTSEMHKRVWEKRCQWISCQCCTKKRSLQNSYAFTEISQLLAKYFSDYDLVPTDIAAGLILLRRMYAAKKKKARMLSGFARNALGCSLSSVPIPLRLAVENDEVALKDLQYYSKYMAAAYGWSMFRQMNTMCSWPCKAVANMNCGLGCCGCGSPYEWDIQDTHCQCNLAAVTEIIDEEDGAEVLYSNWHAQVFQTPFFVAADHGRRKIVIAVRGTRSFGDALTDLCADFIRINVDGIETAKVHKGMYQAASYVRLAMQTNNVLQIASEKYPGYQLVTVGHSLGAGVACLLALQFREHYPNTKCYAYSPPGSLMNLELAKFSRNFVLTCLVGLDVVPRLSFATMEDLKDEVVRMVAASRTPKWSIIYRSCPGSCCGLYYACGCYCCCPGDEVVQDDIFYSTQAEENIVRLQSNLYHLQRDRYEKERMFLPGRIIHLMHVGKDKSRGFRAVWSGTEDFQKIVISPKMVSDHLVHNVMKALSSVVWDFALERSKSVDSIDGLASSGRRKSFHFRKKSLSDSSPGSEPESSLRYFHLPKFGTFESNGTGRSSVSTDIVTIRESPEGSVCDSDQQSQQNQQEVTAKHMSVIYETGL